MKASVTDILRKSNKTRKIVALSFFVGFLLIFLLVIVWDLIIEKRRQHDLEVVLNPIAYHFELKSFDINNCVVRGYLRLKFLPDLPLPEGPKIKYRFSPLVYHDGASYLMWEGLRSWLTTEVSLALDVRKFEKKEFTEKAPTAIPFELQAIGEPKLYPFGVYLLVGAARCVVKDEPEGASKRLKEQHLEAVSFRQGQ